MNYLKDFIANQNRIKVIFKEPKIYMSSMTQENVESLARSIDSSLSPENLHCDGELSREEAQAKYDYLSRVVFDLKRFCFANDFDMPPIYEL